MKILIFLIVLFFELEPANGTDLESSEVYDYGPVNLRILKQKPLFNKCPGNVVNGFNGLSEGADDIALDFLDYSTSLEEALGSNSIVSLKDLEQNNLKQYLNDDEYEFAYLAVLTVIHPGLLKKAWFTFKHYDSGCMEIVQSAPGGGDTYFRAIAVIKSNVNIEDIRSTGFWY